MLTCISPIVLITLIYGGVVMDEWSSWEMFFTTGSIVDYIRFKTIQRARELGADTVNKEISDEVSDGRTDNQRTKFR